MAVDTQRTTQRMKAHNKHAALAAMLAAAALAAAGCTASRPGPQAGPFTTEVINAYTPVKDQGRSDACWAYAMLAAIETEHIMRGDSVHLSPAYALRSALAEGFSRCYLSRGAVEVATRGTMLTLIATIAGGGIVPYDAYHRAGGDAAAVAARKAGRLAAAEASRRSGLRRGKLKLRRLLDETFGPEPRAVYMLGARYTPQEFARSVCAPGEWVALTSFTHHPFYTDIDLELADNHGRERFRNVPIDTLMACMERAVRAGRGVCWEGDVSEPGFSFGRGVALLPAGTPTGQADRQVAFERFATTDDHCMAVVGLARDARGRLFYIMKNSWGTANPYGGLMYVAEDYVRLKTIAVAMPRN